MKEEFLRHVWSKELDTHMINWRQENQAKPLFTSACEGPMLDAGPP